MEDVKLTSAVFVGRGPEDYERVKAEVLKLAKERKDNARLRAMLGRCVEELVWLRATSMGPYTGEALKRIDAVLADAREALKEDAK